MVVGAEKALPCVWRLKDSRVLGRLVLSQNEVIKKLSLLKIYNVYLL